MHPRPFINTQKERYDMWLLKRYGLPFLYWHLMLRGQLRQLGQPAHQRLYRAPFHSRRSSPCGSWTTALSVSKIIVVLSPMV